MKAGDVLGGRFRLVGELGRGGTATVWLAEDLDDGERTALKILHPHLADNPAAVARLRREVDVARRVNHPNALVARALHDLDGVLALALPVHTGMSLSEHVASQGPWTASALTRLGIQLAEVLGEAHAAGILHRDVSPSNVLVDDDGAPVLTDFGLARIGSHHTMTVTATPGYAAPEVLAGRTPDPRSDLYGVGGVLYMAATGQAPFTGRSPAAILHAQGSGAPRSLASLRPDLPTTLTRTVDALLARDPADRPATSRELIDLLSGRLPPRDAGIAGLDPVTPVLETGPFRVVVSERSDDRSRRTRLRTRLGRQHHWMGRLLEDALDQAKKVVTEMLSLPEHLAPEELLVEAMARLTKLPDDALRVPDAVYSKRFRLLEGVSEPVARRAADAARGAGFDADLAQAQQPQDAPGFGVLGLTMLMFAFLITIRLPLILTILSTWGMFLLMRKRERLDLDHAALPLAFGADLSADVRTVYQPLVTGGTPAPVPEVIAEPPPLHEDLQAQARERIDALESEIVGHEELPTMLRDDLLGSVLDLRKELETAVGALAGLDHSSAHQADAAEAAVNRIQARIRRTHTLHEGGHDVDKDELTALRRTLDEHLSVLAETEAVEGARVKHLARIMDIGAAAHEARRDLFSLSTPRLPGEDVLSSLRNTRRSGAEAMAEVRRAAAARSRQGT